MIICWWDCVKVLAVTPVPNSRVGKYTVTYLLRSGDTMCWTMKAVDELDAYRKVQIKS